MPFLCLPIPARVCGPPAIALAYPARGAATFRATIDGVDRTDRFRVTTTEAWATLGETAVSPATAPTVPAGPHTVVARVCSIA